MTRMRMKMKMRMMTLYQLEISSPGGDRTWACRKVSGFPIVLLPAYSLLKQEQLQLAHPAFVTFPVFFLMFVHWKRTVQIPWFLEGKRGNCKKQKSA